MAILNPWRLDLGQTGVDGPACAGGKGGLRWVAVEVSGGVELAGHASLSTTQRYIHLSPNAKREAIELLERSAAVSPACVASSGWTRRLVLRSSSPTVRAIQELAGHASIMTTQMYMHLSPRAEREAIDLLSRYRRGSNVAAGADGKKKKSDSKK